MENSARKPDLSAELSILKNRLSKLEQVAVPGNMNGKHFVFENYSLEHLTNLLPGIIYITEFKSNDVLWVNYKSLEVLGYGEDEIKKMGPRYYMEFFHPDDKDVFDRFHDFFLEKPGDCYHNAYRLQHRRGGWHWYYSSTIVLQSDENNQPEYMLGIAVDISEQIQINSKLQELLKENIRLKNKLLNSLTDREREITMLIAQGHSSKEIAANLHLSPFTVETHRKNAMQKLDVHNAAGLVRFALENNLVATS